MNSKIVKALDQRQTGNVFQYFMENEFNIESNDGTHKMSTLQNEAYGPPCPVKGGQYTTIKLTNMGYDVFCMDKNTLTARLHFTIVDSVLQQKLNEEYTNSGGNERKQKLIIMKNKATKIFVGFKSGIHFIDAYRIYSKGNKVVEQSEALYENTLERASKCQEELDEKPYTYTTWEHAVQCDDGVCGTYISLEEIRTGMPYRGEVPTPGVVEVVFDVVIQMDDFLPFSGMTMFPSFAFGDLTLDVKMNPRGLVFCQCDPASCYNKYLSFSNKRTDLNTTSLMKMCNETMKAEASKYTHAFTPLNDPMTFALPTIGSWTGSGTEEAPYEIGSLAWQYVNPSFQCRDNEILTLRSFCYCFNLQADSKRQIMSRYAYNKSFIIPGQFGSHVTFSQTPNGMSSFTCTTNVSLVNCSGIGVFFPRSGNDIVCTKNPHCSDINFTIDNNPFPDKSFSSHSVEHAIFQLTNTGLDDLFSPSKEFSHSIKFNEIQNIEGYDGENRLVVVDTPEDNTGYFYYVRTERPTGFGTFNDGITNNNAQISMMVSMDAGSPYLSGKAPEMVIIQDAFWVCDARGAYFYYNDANKVKELQDRADQEAGMLSQESLDAVANAWQNRDRDEF